MCLGFLHSKLGSWDPVSYYWDDLGKNRMVGRYVVAGYELMKGIKSRYVSGTYTHLGLMAYPTCTYVILTSCFLCLPMI